MGEIFLTRPGWMGNCLETTTDRSNAPGQPPAKWLKQINGDFPAFCPSELWVVEGLLVRRLCGVPKAPVQREHTIIISCWNSIGFTDQNRHQAKKPCKQPRPNGHPLTVPSTPAKCPGQHEGKKCLAWVHRLTKSSSQAKLRIRQVIFPQTALLLMVLALLAEINVATDLGKRLAQGSPRFSRIKSWPQKVGPSFFDILTFFDTFRHFPTCFVIFHNFWYFHNFS